MALRSLTHSLSLEEGELSPQVTARAFAGVRADDGEPVLSSLSTR